MYSILFHFLKDLFANSPNHCDTHMATHSIMNSIMLSLSLSIYLSIYLSIHISVVLYLSFSLDRKARFQEEQFWTRYSPFIANKTRMGRQDIVGTCGIVGFVYWQCEQSQSICPFVLAINVHLHCFTPPLIFCNPLNLIPSQVSFKILTSLSG